MLSFHLTSLARSATLCLGLALPLAGALGGDMTARQVTELLFRSTSQMPPDLSGMNLSNLNLAQLNFKKAKLTGVDMFGSDLSGADLTGVDLKSARLDRVRLMGTRFDGADLTGASLLRPTSFSTLQERLSEASSFVGARLVKARVFGQLNGFNFKGADLRGVTFAPFSKTGFIEHIWRTKLDSANLSDANLEGADMSFVSARYANLTNANLRGAVLKNADLSHADFTGADLRNADFTGADLDQAVLRQVKGLNTVRGLHQAHNRNKAIY